MEFKLQPIRGKNMNEKELLKSLCEAHAPSGREHLIYPIIKEAFEPFGEVTLGDTNNVYIHKKGKSKGKGSVMLMAHTDEVFLMITSISDNGFLKFKGVGIDAKTLVSQEVVVHGTKDILGIIGIKPPHLMNNEEKAKSVTMEGLLIDTGETKEEIEKVLDEVKVHYEGYSIERTPIELINYHEKCPV